MTTNQHISDRLRRAAPVPSDSQAFMSDTLRQINLLPKPESREQELLRTLSWREHFAFRANATRWMLLGSSGCLLTAYVAITYSETIFTIFGTMLTSVLAWFALG